jgi:putative transcriptional regulator
LHDVSAQISELYSAYAAGRLSPSFALLVETQAALRPDIRSDLDCAESLTGIFLEGERPDMLAPNAYEKTLQAIDRLEDRTDRLQAAQLASERLSEIMDLPEPLREKALESCVRKGWKRLTSGVSRLELDQAGSDAHLYRIKPGATVPRHSHKGDELTLVVKGGFSDENGSYGPGDLSLQTPEHTHQPVGDDDGVCLALAVCEGGLKFKGMLGLIQKIMP